MKRRVAPPLLALAAAALAPSPTAATWLDDHHLRVRPDMAHELNYVSHGEFAPPTPEAQEQLEDALRHRKAQGVMNRAANKGFSSGKNKAADGCSSPLVEWTTARVREMGSHAYRQLYDNKIPQMAYVYKHYVDKTHDDEFFVDAVQTAELQRRHEKIKRFWREADVDNSIRADDVLLLSMHGEDLKDHAKLVPTLMKMFDFDETSDVLAFAKKVQGLIENLPGGYDNPLLTMNAVATRSTFDHGTFNGHSNPNRRVKDSLIIGDGVLQFLYDSGLQSSGPDFVHAHEFGHHLQFQMDIAVPPGAKYVHDDRRKELMADALGGYFLAHDRGGDFNAQEIEVFDRTAFATGDCTAGRDDHHGTPDQRRCAAVWGASVAAPDGRAALDPEMFVRSFNEVYVGMLGLEERVCALVLEEDSSDVPAEGAVPVESRPVAEFNVDASREKEDEKDEPPSIQEWLEAVEQQNNLEGNGAWTDRAEPATGNSPPSLYTEPQDPISGVPAEEEPSWEIPEGVYDQTYRGRPSSSTPVHGIVGTQPNSEEEGNHLELYQHLADRGTVPSETRERYAAHEVSVRDCQRPWVYCPSVRSGGAATRGAVWAVGMVSMVVAGLVLQ